MAIFPGALRERRLGPAVDQRDDTIPRVRIQLALMTLEDGRSSRLAFGTRLRHPHGRQDGQPFEETQKTENFVLKLGDGHISEEFDKGVVGMSPGDEKEITVAFPEDYFNKKLVGLTVDFKVKLNDIRKEVLPEIDDELAKQLGPFTTLDEVKRVMKPGGRLAVVEFKKIPGPPGPPEKVRLSPEDLDRVLSPIGFECYNTVELGPETYLSLFMRTV